jgi:hypothetical protein
MSAINSENSGEIEDLEAKGWVSQWTTAPIDYDCFGTATAEQCGDWHGKPLRRILSHPHHADYQAARNGSGMHPTWSADPRIERRALEERAARIAQRDIEDAARRTTGLAWLAGATEAEIKDIEERDEVESRGLKYTDLGDEIRHRAGVVAEAARTAEWDRCRSSFQDGAILVDEGTSGFRGTYGGIAGQPTHIYYEARVTGDWRKVADEATVVAAHGDDAGSLAVVAEHISTGRFRVVSADDVPPEPVTRRIGHSVWRKIVKVQVADRLVWIGRVSGAYELMVLDAKGRIVRAKAACERAIAEFHAIDR